MIPWLERRPEFLCFLLGLLCTLPLIFLTPPFQVPDEPQHFYRAYQVSELSFIASLKDQNAGGMLPSSLIELSTLYLNTRAIHGDRPVLKRPWSAVFDGLSVRLEQEKREFIDFSGAAFYSPIPYFPQSVAIAAGRFFGAGPLLLLYLGRFVNATIAIFLLSLAVRYSPVAKLAFMIAGLLPMSVYLYGSFSPDALVIGSAYLFTALALRTYQQKLSLPELLIAIVCGTIFCSVKIVYAPLLLIALPAVFSIPRRVKALFYQIAIIAMPLAVTVAWLHAVSGQVVPVKVGTSVATQAHYVINHPLAFLKAAVHGFMWNDFFFYQTIGILGWLTVQLPAISYILPVIAFGIVAFSADNISWGRSIPLLLWWGILASACLGLIMLALYLYWSVVAGSVVEGVQGRYFIPVIPLFAVVIASAVSTFKWTVPASKTLSWIATIVVAEALLTFFSLSRSYWTL